MNVDRATPGSEGSFLLQLSYQDPITNGKKASSFLSKIQPLFFIRCFYLLLLLQNSLGLVTSLLETDEFSFPTRPCRDLFSELEDTFPQTDLVPHFWAVRNADLVGQKNICSKHFQGQFPSERMEIWKTKQKHYLPHPPKPKTWCCTLTGLALGHRALCLLGQMSRTVWFSPKLASVQVSSKILIDYKKNHCLSFTSLWWSSE